jgi:hypothetical protein
MGVIWPKITQNGPKWAKMSQNVPKWPKLAGIDQNRPKLVQLVKIWVTKVQKVPPKHKQKCPKNAKMSKNEFEEKTKKHRNTHPNLSSHASSTKYI